MGSSPRTTAPPTSSFTTPPSRLTVSAVLQRTSGSSSPPARAPRARRPSRLPRSNQPGSLNSGEPLSAYSPSHRQVLPVLLEFSSKSPEQGGQLASAESGAGIETYCAMLIAEDYWRSVTACRTADPDLFFPGPGNQSRTRRGPGGDGGGADGPARAA